MAKAGAIRAGRAFVELFADDSKLAAGLRQASAKLKAFGASVTSRGKQMPGIGAAIATPLAFAVKVFADFDDQMRSVRGVTGATGEAFVMLTEKAKELGRTTSFTASQVAEGMLELGRAGFNPAEI